MAVSPVLFCQGSFFGGGRRLFRPEVPAQEMRGLQMMSMTLVSKRSLEWPGMREMA